MPHPLTAPLRHPISGPAFRLSAAPRCTSCAAAAPQPSSRLRSRMPHPCSAPQCAPAHSYGAPLLGHRARSSAATRSAPGAANAPQPSSTCCAPAQSRGPGEAPCCAPEKPHTATLRSRCTPAQSQATPLCSGPAPHPCAVPCCAHAHPHAAPPPSQEKPAAAQVHPHRPTHTKHGPPPPVKPARVSPWWPGVLPRAARYDPTWGDRVSRPMAVGSPLFSGSPSSCAGASGGST